MLGGHVVHVCGWCTNAENVTTADEDDKMERKSGASCPQ